MNENTTADTSVNATAIDDETLSRAVLTYCLDSADAMMYALVKGIGSATHTLQLLADSGPGNHESVATAAYKTLDAALINGITRWGRTINARGMASFHGAMVSWQHRLTTLPSTDPEELKTWFTANGTQWIVAPHHPPVLLSFRLSTFFVLLSLVHSVRRHCFCAYSKKSGVASIFFYASAKLYKLFCTFAIK